MKTHRGERAPFTTPRPETEPESSSSRWPVSRRHDPRYENPSLERYTDLRFDEHPRKHRRWVIAIAAVMLFLVVMVLGFMMAIYSEARSDDARQVDAIVVMGAAQYNGRPSEVLRARLDHALDLYQQGYAPVIIVTGGKMEGDVFTEAGTSEQYLLDRGVPQSAILMEDVGRDTWASMQGVSEVADRRGVETVLIVSDGFHLFRSERMAEAVGLDAHSSPAPDSPIRPNSANEFSYIIRETGAVILQMPDWLF